MKITNSNFTKTDLFIFGIVVCGLVFLWIYTAINYSALPSVVPTQFNGSGKIVTQGNKSVLWMLPAISSFTTIILLFISYLPDIRQFRLLHAGVQGLAFSQLFLMGTGLVEIVRVSRGSISAFPIPLLIIPLVCCGISALVLIAGCIIAAIKKASGK